MTIRRCRRRREAWGDTLLCTTSSGRIRLWGTAPRRRSTAWMQDAAARSLRCAAPRASLRSLPPRVLWRWIHLKNLRFWSRQWGEVQDFTTKFFLVAPEERYEKFKTETSKRAFEPIAKRCNFRSYKDIEEYYQRLLNYSTIRNLL